MGPLDSLNMLLKQSSAPEETAAIIIEPIQGEGGFLTPPPGFLPGLRKICDDHNIVLILDEVRGKKAYNIYCPHNRRYIDIHSLVDYSFWPVS